METECKHCGKKIGQWFRGENLIWKHLETRRRMCVKGSDLKAEPKGVSQ